jgi:hypothetical protein
LIERRDAIGRAYLTGVNPLVNVRLDDAGTLRFDNAAAKVAEAPAAYEAAWARYDNATDTSTPIAKTQSRTTTIAAPGNLPSAPGTFIEVVISTPGATQPVWKQPLKSYFRRTARGWTLVGLDRGTPSGDVQ